MFFRKNNNKSVINNSDEITERLLFQITPEVQRSIDLKMNLAVKILKGMKTKGWNKSEFALQMNKNNSVITRWLSGVHNFEIDTLIEIQEKLNIKLLDC